MKVLVDLQGLQTLSRHRGIGRYTRDATKAFIARAGSHEVHVALNAALDEDGSDAAIAEFLSMLPRDRIHYLRLPCGIAEHRPLAGAWRRAAAARLMRHALDSVGADVVWHSSVFEGMIDDAAIPDVPSPRHVSAATLYDLIPLHDPALHLPNAASHDWYARRLAFLRRCDLLLAISEWTRQDAIARLDLPAERIVVIGGAVDARFMPPAAAGIDLAASGITRPFVLYNGGLDPRKNVATLVRAFAALPEALRARHQLVVVGKGDDERRTLARLGATLGLADGTLLLPGYVPDDQLVTLYGRCALFVFPSRFEGLGLPPLEAMACGAPVLCSNATSLSEVVGRDDALFDPDDLGQLRERMEAVLADPQRAGVLRESGRRRAQAMTWDAVAARAWAGIEAAHAQRATSSIVTAAATSALATVTQDSVLLTDLAALDATPDPDDVAQVAYGIAAMRRPSGDRRWLVDVSSIARHDLGTGIQQVVRNLLREWLQAPPPGVRIEPVRFDAGHFRHARDYARRLGMAMEGDDGFAMARPEDIFVGLDWAFEQMPAMRARVADWRRGGMRSCFVVYDLLPITLPEHFHPHARERFTQWLDGAVHLADRFACISRTTADALSTWLGTTGARDQFGRRAPVAAFPLGADTAARNDHTSPLRAALGQAVAARPTLLMVGTLEPRKGHADALDLCEALWQRGIDVNLVVAGRRGWMTEALVARLKTHPERHRRLFWHEDVGDAELGALYAGSSALLALSHGEGYGLPLVEAARSGLPVFARDLPVFREVLGDYPQYLAGRAEAWAPALAHWLASPVRKDPPRLPTWADSARVLAEIVRGALDD